MGATAASRRYENSRPSAAPICAISLVAASRSIRAINESCRVAGIASDGSGAMAMYRSPAARSCPNSNTVLVSSSTNNGTPSVLRMISP